MHESQVRRRTVYLGQLGDTSMAKAFVLPMIAKRPSQWIVMFQETAMYMMNTITGKMIQSAGSAGTN